MNEAEFFRRFDRHLEIGADILPEAASSWRVRAESKAQQQALFVVIDRLTDNGPPPAAA
jgi:hypothetical protein